MAHIDVSMPGFLAQRDLPPVVLPLQQVFLEATVAPREEISSSRLSLKEEIASSRLSLKETQGAQIVHISDAEDEPDRYLSVHTPILVIARPDGTSEKEVDEMALIWENKSLRDFMAARNKGSTSQEVPKSQVPPIFPLLPPTNLGLHAIPNLKKKRPV